eukprot:3198343-Amphidinium_carterae.1
MLGVTTENEKGDAIEIGDAGAALQTGGRGQTAEAGLGETETNQHQDGDVAGGEMTREEAEEGDGAEAIMIIDVHHQCLCQSDQLHLCILLVASVWLRACQIKGMTGEESTETLRVTAFSQNGKPHSLSRTRTKPDLLWCVTSQSHQQCHLCFSIWDRQLETPADCQWHSTAQSTGRRLGSHWEDRRKSMSDKAHLSARCFQSFAETMATDLFLSDRGLDDRIVDWIFSMDTDEMMEEEVLDQRLRVALGEVKRGMVNSAGVTLIT